MTMTASSIQPGFEPIPGYVLRNKLGCGGYGEVWLAEAPGGLKKAIKFVHGTIDSAGAAGELKSLQRVRQVNHPFILSLERIEVIEGRLIIVTELAQCSLYDRYMEFRQKGFVGIERERLIGYMRDTADGLDFICKHHDLQHLDVKPANLLLVADRVKVADFGLIKDIQSNSLSAMSGLTPTYAAPEMFDGRPGRFTDQYSLAIVYQELLTGTLPFRGRTTAQLANEHLHKAPNLEAIPLVERPVLSKALAKKPNLRFGDCREFINALEIAHAQSSTLETDEYANGPQRKKPLSSRSANSNKPPRSARIQNIQSQRLRKLPEMPPSCNTESQIDASIQSRSVDLLPTLLPTPTIADSASVRSESASKVARKSLIIGLGETGAKSLIRLRQKILETNQDLLDCEQLGFLLVDSDKKTIESALDLDRIEGMPYHATILIPLKPPQYYRQSSIGEFPQLSRRWVYNIPRSLKTEGVRPLGMLAFLDNAAIVLEALQESLLEIAKSNGEELSKEPISVQIVASAHGGTGSAIASEIGFLVRQLAAEFEIPINVEMTLTCATPNGIASTDLTTASALSCLMEINHYFNTEGLHPPIDQIPASRAIYQPPFDHVSLIYGGQCGSHQDWEAVTIQAAEYLWACTATELGSRIARTRIEDNSESNHKMDQGWTKWLSTVHSRQVEIVSQIEPVTAASRLCLRAILPWLSALDDVLSEKNHGDASPQAADPKIIEQMDFFVGDMFRSNHWTAQAWVRECMLRVVPDSNESDSSKEAYAAIADFSRPHLVCNLDIEQREDLAHVCLQLALDMQIATQNISKLIASTHDNLADWLFRRWLTNPLAWAHLKQVVRLVAKKFSVNANSLFVVSQKLADNHAALLNQLNSGIQKASPECEQTLHAMALEAKLHTMGAKMLARMAEHMAYLEDLWLNECKLLHAEICNWMDDLVNRLGLRLDNSPHSNSTLSALFQTEADDAASKDVRQALQTLLANRLKNVLGDSRKPSFLSEDKPISFQDILESASQSFLLSQSSDRKTTDVKKSTDPVVAVDTGPVSNPIHSKPPTTDSSSQLEIEGSTLEEKSLEIEIDSTRPYFVEFGGAVRNAVLLPSTIAKQLDSKQKAIMEDRNVAIVVSQSCQQSAIFCLGERLELSGIMDRVWMPSSDIWNLANRVLARVDVDWLPVSG